MTDRALQTARMLIARIVAPETPRAAKAKAFAEVIRSLPAFPISMGLTSAAIREKKTIVVGDVRNDPRYLTALGNTLSEMIVPVLDSARQKVIGTIVAGSELADAFSVEQAAEIEEFALLARPLWTSGLIPI